MKIKFGIGLIVVGLGLSQAEGVPPTIHVAWDEAIQPVVNQDYFIHTTSPATEDFPNVELTTGSLTWRIWSTDTDNTDNIGDIGVISSPSAANFAVAIRSDPATYAPGARNVKGIVLVPTSPANHGSVSSGIIAGQITDEVTVQADAFSNGGELNLIVSGAVTADMTIRKVNYLGISNTVSGAIVIDELAGGLDMGGLTGSVSIGTISAYGSNIRIFNPLSGSLEVTEFAEYTAVFLPTGLTASGLLSFGDLLASIAIQIGSSPGFREMAGTIQFHGGINDSVVNIYAELTLSGVIDLNHSGVSEGGEFNVLGGGEGSIINGGLIVGSVSLGQVDIEPMFPTEFSGEAHFAGSQEGSSIVLGSVSKHDS